MKFDDLVNYIAENNLPTTANEDLVNDGRKPGARAAWLKANPGKKGSDYYAMLRKQQKGEDLPASPVTDVPADSPTDMPVSDEPEAFYKELPDTLNTKVKIAEIIAADPTVKDEEIMARLQADAEQGEILNLDPDVVKQEISAARVSEPGTSPEADVGSSEEKKLKAHAAIAAAMARRGMKVGDPEKVFKKLGKFRAKSRGKSEEEGETETDLPATDDVGGYLKSMKRSRYDTEND